MRSEGIMKEHSRLKLRIVQDGIKLNNLKKNQFSFVQISFKFESLHLETGTNTSRTSTKLKIIYLHCGSKKLWTLSIPMNLSLAANFYIRRRNGIHFDIQYLKSRILLNFPEPTPLQRCIKEQEKDLKVISSFVLYHPSPWQPYLLTGFYFYR